MTAPDSFWDVRAQERDEEDALKRKLGDVQRVMALGRRALALKGAAGFQDFLKAVGDLHAHGLMRLARAPLDNDTLREQRGRVSALRDVLQLLEKSEESVERLAVAESDLQTQLKAALHARPKPRSE